MSLRFPYQQTAKVRPIVPLKGRGTRPRPVVPVALLGPSEAVPQDALLDTGADDTIFPERVAAFAGIDLTNAPQGTGGGLGIGAVVRYAEVTLRLSDGRERREWRAWVGFATTQARYPML